MPTTISISSVIAILIRVLILILLVIFSLKKYTNEQIFRSAGGFIIGGSAMSLLLAVFELIRSAIGAAGVTELFAATTAVQIKLLLSVTQLAVGIIICKSGSRIPAPISAVLCVMGILSAIDCFTDPSFLSYFTFVFMFLPIMALLRQLRDRRRRPE